MTATMSDGAASATNSHCQPARPATPLSPNSVAETGDPTADDSGTAAMK